MDLSTLEGVQQKLQEQYHTLKANIDGDKPVKTYANLMEVCGAMQLASQLIQQEKIALAAPPGSLGPIL